MLIFPGTCRINLPEGTFFFHMLFDNSVHDLCIFLDRWTRGRRVPRQPLPWHCHTQQSPRAFPESPLLKDRLGIAVPGRRGSHLCFHLFFNSSLLNFASSPEFFLLFLLYSLHHPGNREWGRGRAILGCCQGSSKTPWSSCWVGHAPVYVFGVETSKNCSIQASCLSQLPSDLTFNIHATKFLLVRQNPG